MICNSPLYLGNLHEAIHRSRDVADKITRNAPETRENLTLAVMSNDVSGLGLHPLASNSQTYHPRGRDSNFETETCRNRRL